MLFKLHKSGPVLAMLLLWAVGGIAQSAAGGANLTPVGWETIDGGKQFTIAFPKGYKGIVDGDYYLGEPNGNHVKKHVTVYRSINGVVLQVEFYQGDVKDIQAALIKRGVGADKNFELVKSEKLDSLTNTIYKKTGAGIFQYRQYLLFKSALYVIHSMATREDDPILCDFVESLRVVANNTVVALNSPAGDDVKLFKIRQIMERPEAANDDETFSGKPDRDIVILSKPRPSYTAEARRAGDAGEVVLKVLFSASGRIAKIAPVAGPKSLFNSSISAAERIQFIPAENGGKPVSVWKSITYTFSIY